MSNARNTASFARIVRTHVDALYRAAYRLAGNRADAEDLVQETCTRAFENRAELTTADRPLGWLLKVQYRVFLDGARRRKRAPFEPMSDDAEALPAEDLGAEALAHGAEVAQTLERAWAALKDQQRALLTLQAEGYSLAEIRQITDLPTDVLKARRYRARMRLGKLIGAHDAAPAPVLES